MMSPGRNGADGADGEGAGAAGQAGLPTVVFDLDGTLADTSGDLIAAANAVFRDRGHGDMLDPRHDRSTAMRGGRAMLKLGYARLAVDDAEARVDADYPDLLDAYGAALCVHTRLFPGAAEAVSDLRSAGYATAICTNKPEGLAEALMTALGVRALFSALVGADTLPVRKPDPAPLRAAVDRSGGEMARTLLVGDTETDRQTALAAGVACALVTFGPDGEGTAALDPDALLRAYADLPAIAAALIGPGATGRSPAEAAAAPIAAGPARRAD